MELTGLCARKLHLQTFDIQAFTIQIIMQKHFLLFIVVLLIAGNFVSMKSAMAQQNLTNVNNLTDEQIQKIIDEMRDQKSVV